MANIFKNYTSKSIGVTPTKIGGYTVPANTSTTVIGLTIANVSNSPVTAAVLLNSNSANSPVTAAVLLNSNSANTYMIRNAPIPVGSTLVVVGGDQKIAMQTGNEIFVQSSAATSLDVIMSVLEIT